MALRWCSEEAIGNMGTEISVRTGLFGVGAAGKHEVNVVGMLDQHVVARHDRDNVRLVVHPLVDDVEDSIARLRRFLDHQSPIRGERTTRRFRWSTSMP